MAELAGCSFGAGFIGDDNRPDTSISKDWRPGLSGLCYPHGLAPPYLGRCEAVSHLLRFTYSWAMGTEHKGLKPGLLHHEKCENCRETRPALKIQIDDEDPLVSIERYIACGTFVWNFSVGLRAMHHVTKAMEDVVRACSAHANYHVHFWNYLYPRRKLVPESLGVLDNEEQAHVASMDAYSRVVSDAVERREEWRARKH